ncbi:MAG TPA: phosphomannomutase/phosphoglucomutase [Aggregatilinea sp.]|uniref:phosphomannomutase/phosphoglucomutase n=1 Tax=Aggregatilinea sp. TaxID=2806333 RepID=UPI002B95DBD1|nr:phosphomannomutase/phosphoglucomutase [Aggregatilinea sp.]HML24049.1 phosphomannomutase/phosphoglucomutase [Aggregatilinea sp.]
MAQVPTHVFRKYDIRGKVTGETPDLTPDLARWVGKAYGTYVQRNLGVKQVFVGGDNRLTTPAIKDALIEGLATTGIKVTDIGPVMTPTVYFASSSNEAAGGIMITGSHLTTDYNGIKMSYGRQALADDQIQDLLKLIQADDFEQGKGEVLKDYAMIDRHMETIKGKVHMGDRKLKVVVDSGNGLSGTYVPPVMEALGVEVICLFCEPDGTFPNHLPNPEDPELTKDLEAAVIANKADFGIAFDGDADRAGVIDEHGHHVAADRLLALLARDLLTRMPGSTIVFDVKSSQVLPDIIRESGGKPLMWQSGHSLMKRKMAEVGSPLGGEVSGHLFIGENYYGFDDGPLVALKVLELFSKTDKTLSQALGEMPSLIATPEIIMSAPDDVKFKIIDVVRDELQDKYEVVTVDGARAIFENGWGLVRASNTQPAITMRFEAHTRPQIVEYMKRFEALLDDYPQVDREKLDKQIEAFSQPA